MAAAASGAHTIHGARHPVYCFKRNYLNEQVRSAVELWPPYK